MRSRLGRTADLVAVLARREFRARYRQSVLELSWSLITPVVTLAVYGIVLTRVFDVRSPDVPYLSLVWTGMVAWMMFSSAVGGGVHSIVRNADIVSKVHFPREVLPLAVVGASFFDLGIGTSVLVPVVAVQIGSVSITALAVVPAIVVLVLWTAAIATFLAAFAVFVRDATHAVGLILQVTFFVTPVMYPATGLPRGLEVLNTLNPLAVCIEALRDAVLHQRWPEWPLLGIHTVGGAVALLLAVAYTRAVDGKMADVI